LPGTGGGSLTWRQRGSPIGKGKMAKTTRREATRPKFASHEKKGKNNDGDD
jgi:hypothetical protein